MGDLGTSDSKPVLPARRLGRRILHVLCAVALAVLALVVLVAAGLVINDVTGERAAKGALAELARRGLPVTLPWVEQKPPARDSHPTLEEVASDGAPFFDAALHFATSDKAEQTADFPIVTGHSVHLGQRVDPKTVPYLEQLVRGHDQFYSMVEAGRGRQTYHYDFDPTESPMGERDELSGLRSAANLLGAKAILQQARGDGDAALDECAVMLAVARSFDRYPLLIVGLTRGIVEGKAIYVAEDTLARTTPTPAALGRLRDRFSSEAAAPNLKELMQGDLASDAHVLRDTGLYAARMEYSRCKITSWVASSTSGFEPAPHSLWERLLLRFAPPHPWHSTVAGYERLYARTIMADLVLYDDLALPTPVLAARLRTFLQQAAKGAPVDFFEVSGLQHLLADQAEMRVAAVALSIEMYRQQQGHWPETLQELKDVDTADPFTGAPMQYTKTADGRLLYSIGMNGRDDGGRSGSAGGPQDSDDLTFRLLDPDKRNRP